MQVPDADLEDWEGEKDHPPSKDLMFDSWLSVPEQDLERLVGDTLRQVYGAMLKARAGKVLGADVSREIGQIVPTIITNLVHLQKFPPAVGSRLAVPMDHSRVTRYDREGFRQLPDVVNVMADLGLIKKHPHTFQEMCTAVEAAGSLREMLLREGLALGDIVRVEGEETIQVTARPENRRSGPRRRGDRRRRIADRHSIHTAIISTSTAGGLVLEYSY